MRENADMGDETGPAEAFVGEMVVRDPPTSHVAYAKCASVDAVRVRIGNFFHGPNKQLGTSAPPEEPNAALGKTKTS